MEKEIVLMQCNTNYTNSPDNFSHINLKVIDEYGWHYEGCGYELGLSDHTPGYATVLGAVTLGARVIEKHFTDNNQHRGPDHAFSMMPTAWAGMVDRTRELERALGDGNKKVEENERETVIIQRRAIRARNKIAIGDKFSLENLICLRPCPEDALPPYEIERLCNQVSRREIEAGDCLRDSDLEL